MRTRRAAAPRVRCQCPLASITFARAFEAAAGRGGAPAAELLIKGLTVDGLPGWDGGRSQTIRYIDWDTPANNRFTVVNQYRVDCPAGFNSAKAFIVPDLVLLVNGVPLVVVECKSPSAPQPLAAGLDQLRRYSNQRRAAFKVEDNEGNETLFATNQLLVATSFNRARVGCVGAAFEHHAQWKTVVGPDGTGGESNVAHALGKAKSPAQYAIDRCQVDPDAADRERLTTLA